jgi:dCMP deaminase
MEHKLHFGTEIELLDYVTRNWQSNFVTTELNTRTSLEKFRTRPFFMVLSVDAPILTRYRRNAE